MRNNNKLNPTNNRYVQTINGFKTSTLVSIGPVVFVYVKQQLYIKISGNGIHICNIHYVYYYLTKYELNPTIFLGILFPWSRKTSFENVNKIRPVVTRYGHHWLQCISTGKLFVKKLFVTPSIYRKFRSHLGTKRMNYVDKKNEKHLGTKRMNFVDKNNEKLFGDKIN